MFNGEILKNAIISGANNISSQKNQINDLNIFPVPDGDTGTNMSMTIMAAAKALADYDGDDAGEQVDDVPRVADFLRPVVRVVDDARGLVRLDVVAINDPLDRRT